MLKKLVFRRVAHDLAEPAQTHALKEQPTSLPLTISNSIHRRFRKFRTTVRQRPPSVKNRVKCENLRGYVPST